MALICLVVCLLLPFVWSEAGAAWILWEQEVTAESSEPIQDFEYQPVSRAKKVQRGIYEWEAACEGERDGLLEGSYRRLQALMAEEVTRGASGLSWFAIGHRQWTGILWSCVQESERRGPDAPAAPSDTHIAERAIRQATEDGIPSLTPPTTGWRAFENWLTAADYDPAWKKAFLAQMRDVSFKLSRGETVDGFSCPAPLTREAWLADHRAHWGSSDLEAQMAYWRSGYHAWCP